MCGIAGIVDSAGGITADVITAMRDTLRHRGPDDAGLWLADDATVGLGHRRLSILDLSKRGHQPMADPAGEVRVVYNGEIYNFREVRGELQQRGVAFVSDTDTEVLLQAYLAWGIDCLDKLEGMFAAAIVDARSRTTYLVRDRLGIKPLFYAVDGGRLVFGSEIRAVLASGRVPTDLAPEAAVDFFSAGYVPAPATIYRAIRKLPPASVLTFRDGQTEVARWWQPSFDCLGDDSATAAARLREHVDAAVEAYLVSDVPVGAYLSGGLDSTIVTARAAEVFGGDLAERRLGGQMLQTFTIGFDVEEHSEVDYARTAAEAAGTVHHELTVTRQMAHDRLDDVIALFDEPFAASSTIPMLFVAELARRNVTVALCGEGGDEAFGGYSWYRWWLRFQQPSFWRSGLGRFCQRTMERLTGHRKRKWYLPSLESVDLYAQLMGAMTDADKRRIFSPDVLAAAGGRDSAAVFREDWREDLPPMSRMQWVDMATFLPDLNLARADRTSMAVSLELRVPLLNHRLIEYVCGLPASVRNPDNQLKGLFKRAMAERLPESIRTRKKKGFSAPVKQWFTNEQLIEQVRAVRCDQPELATAWLSPGLERYAARVRGSRAYKLWVFLRWLARR